MNKHPEQKHFGRAVCLGIFSLTALIASFAGVAAQEPAPLSQFAGFTRPGNPNDTEKDGVVVPAAINKAIKETGIGGTVYFMVLERQGKGADVWETGLEDFQSKFQGGVYAADSSPELDTAAKYLYLYQVVNDRKTLAPIESVSIKLDVEMKDITSWGYFTGIGLATTQPAKNQDKTEIRPVAAFNIVTADKKAAFYQDKAPPVTVPKLFKLAYVPTKKGEQPGAGIKLAKGIVQLHWDALDPATDPDHTMLLNSSDFGGNPSFRANWNAKNLIASEGRSTVFGFTSNLPPQFEPVRIRGKKVDPDGKKIVPAKVPGDEGNEDKILAIADGNVPTPKPEKPSVATNPVFMPPAGGAAAPGLPLAGGFPATGGGGGGLSGVGGSISASTTGGGSSTGSGSHGQQQQQQQQKPGITINNTNQQQQQQQQQQRQHQSQGGHGHGHHVVPAPPALVLAALGLPFLMLVRRRKTVS